MVLGATEPGIPLPTNLLLPAVILLLIHKFLLFKELVLIFLQFNLTTIKRPAADTVMATEFVIIGFY